VYETKQSASPIAYRLVCVVSVIIVTDVYSCLTRALSGDAVHCYVCNTGEKYHGNNCSSESLHKDLLKDCDDEGLRDGKNYTMCRTFIQDGKSEEL